MKQALRIGITKLNPEWQALLNQVGVWYEAVSHEQIEIDNYSTIILNSEPDRLLLIKIREYLKNGGSVILIKKHHGFFPDKIFSNKYLKRIINPHDLKGFEHISYLDLHADANTIDPGYFQGLLGFKKVMKGDVAYIAFNPVELLANTEYRRKRFYTGVGAEPDEIVNSVSKKEVSDLFLQVLRELHFREQLPFIRKWTSPKKKPVFCFRIDSDFSSSSKLNEVYKFLTEHSIKATWFLHVQAHEDHLTQFKSFKNQEIALHGYEHGTSVSYKKVVKNIAKGLQYLEDHEFDINGFCAPYGIYNKALDKALTHFDFSYTSEFSFIHDSLPLKTNQNKLQIPIHPICTGSLSRKRYSVESMQHYFEEKFRFKLSRHEPVLFYHHPMQPGLEIFKPIFNLVKNEAMVNLTFSEFADFWNERDKCKFKAYYDSSEGYIDCNEGETQLFEVSFDNVSSVLINSKKDKFSRETSKDIVINKNNMYDNVPDDLSLKNQLRLLKTSLIDFKNRDRL